MFVFFFFFFFFCFFFFFFFCFFLFFFFFFFKQKTAYEISECDWSSDVCSSDLTLFRSQAEDGIEISECDWSSDVCSSDPLFPYTTLFRSDRKSTRLNSSHIKKSRMP